jgi:cytochrome P450
VSAFDPMSPEFLADPLATLARVRKEAAALRHEEGWPAPVVSLLRHAEVKAAYRDFKTFSSYIPEDARELELADGNSLIGEDPPLHTHLRGAVNKVFTAHEIAKLEAVVEETCEAVFDDALAAGEIDMVEDLAARITVAMIARLVGIPEADFPLIREWTVRQAAINGASVWLSGEDDPRIERFKRVTREANDEMQAYFAERVAERQRAPRDDILTRLVQSGLTSQEAISFAKLLVMAGNETTTNLINNAAIALIDHPEQERILRADPDLAGAAIEEVLRFLPPILYSVRTAVAETELGGVPIHPDEVVVLWAGSANHDERVFEAPERFDVRREPKGVMSFGFGIHACLGSPLARLEGRTFLATFLRRTRAIERVSDELPRATSPIFNGVTRQRVRLYSA